MSKYPSNLDDDSSLPSVIDESTEISGDVVNALKSAVLAVQRAIGSNPQGALADLVSRLAVSINDDGTLKSSALVVAAIVNSHISASAGIQESKLALDFSTQFLRDQITSNDIDIQVLQAGLAQLVADFASHHLSGAFRHDSQQILLDSGHPATTPPWLVGITATTVEDAIRELAEAIAAHTSPSAVDAHDAASISVVGSFGYITADNVQDALEQLESQRSAELRQHLDDAHSNGISAWENDPLDWNRNLQLYPVSGTTAATVISRYVLDLGTDNLRSFRVARGEVLVFDNDAYVIADVGPRTGIGSKPTLDATQIELFRPLPVSSGVVQVAVFGRSSVPNLKVALAATPFPGVSTAADTVLLARPNSAKVVSLNFNPLFVDSGCHLRIQVSTGTSTTKTVTVDNLHRDRDGLTSIAKVSAASVANRINYVLCSVAAGNFVPAAAYVIGNEIAIVHNWSDSADFWLSVIADTPQSIRGAEMCGFGSNGAGMVGVRAYPTVTGRFTVNGNVHPDFATYYSGAASISGSTIGITGSVSALGILPGHVVHIRTAGSSSNIGSYQIIAVGPNTMQLGVALTATTSAVIAVDASSVSLADLNGAPRAAISEIFVDRDGFTGAHLRATAQEGIAGIEVVDISDSRLAGTETLVATTPAAGQVLLQFASAGSSKTIRSSISGRTRVYDRTGMSWMDLRLTGPVGTGSTQFEFFDHSDEEEVLEIAAVRFFDRRVRSIGDRRLFGSLGLDELREDVTQAYVETPLAELRSSGIVRGFKLLEKNIDAASVSPNYPTSTKMVLIDGGIAYVDGVRVEQTSQYVAIPPAAGKYFLCINAGAMFQVVSETDFSLAEIIEGIAGSLVPLALIERNATDILTDNSIEIAYNIANIDERVDAVLDLTNNFVGNFSNISSAIAHLNAYPFEERARLRIVSRRAESSADDIDIAGLSAPATIQIDGYLRKITASSSCSLRADTFAGRAQPHAGMLLVKAEQFNASGLILSEVTVDLAGITSGAYLFENCEFVEGAVITVLGSSLGSITFKECSSRGGSFSMTCNSTAGHIKIDNCNFSATPSVAGSAHGGTIDLKAASCSIQDTVLVGTGFTWRGGGSEFGLNVSNLEITDVSVTSSRNAFTCTDGHAFINDLRVRRSFRQSGTIVDLGQSATSRIAGLLIDTCEVQFSVGVASLLRGGGESVLDGAILSELSMPLPASTDPHIAIPNVFGFLYDGAELISIIADNISESVGVGSSTASGTDGITSYSSTSSLVPGSSGLNISIGALPAGSSYILSGNTVMGFLAGQNFSMGSATGFAERGLLQSHVGPSGAIGVSYRVQKRPDSSDPLELGFVKILDISDGHPVTPSSGFASSGYQLKYEGGELSWALGEPVVPVDGSRYKLYASDYSGWIEVLISGSPVGSGTDRYRVLPSVKNDGKLLIGHYSWDGSASLGSPVDKRYFGNIAAKDLSDDAKSADVLANSDNRGDDVYSGGLVVAGSAVGLDPNSIRIYGPLVVYVAGRRFTPALSFGSDSVNSGKGGFAGIAMPSSDNYIYVDGSGILQISTSWPLGIAHVKIARVPSSGGVVLSSSIEDYRKSSVFLTSGEGEQWSIDTTPTTLSINTNAAGAAKNFNIGTVGKIALNLGSAATDSNIILNSAVTATMDATFESSFTSKEVARLEGEETYISTLPGTSFSTKTIIIGSSTVAGSTTDIGIGTLIAGTSNLQIGSKNTGASTVNIGAENSGSSAINIGISNSGTNSVTIGSTNTSLDIRSLANMNGGIGVSSVNALNIGNVSGITSAGGINIGTANALGPINIGRPDYLTPSIQITAKQSRIDTSEDIFLGSGGSTATSAGLVTGFAYGDSTSAMTIIRAPRVGGPDATEIEHTIDTFGSHPFASAKIHMRIPNGGASSTIALEANSISLVAPTGGVSVTGNISISGDILGSIDIQSDLNVGDDLTVEDVLTVNGPLRANGSTTTITGDLKIEPSTATNNLVWRYVNVPVQPAHYITQVDFPGDETNLPSSPFDFRDEFGSFNSSAAGYIGMVDITGLLGWFPQLRQIEVGVTKVSGTTGADFRMALVNELGQKLTVSTGGTVSVTGTEGAWFSNTTYRTYIGYSSTMTTGTTYEGVITWDVTNWGGAGNLILNRDGITSVLPSNANPSRRVYLAWRAKNGTDNDQWQVNYVRLKVGNPAINNVLGLTSY